MTELYLPTADERLRVKIEAGNFKVSGDQVFFTFQGEGQSIGKPAVFLRLHFCNLQCNWCDTKYTWDKKSKEFWQESEDWTLQDTTDEITQHPTRRLVITGGEPMLQQDIISQLLDLIPDWEVEIETNGTIPPLPSLAEKCQFNVSPKLENSTNTKHSRYKPDVLKVFNKLPNTTFKFVVQTPADLEEVGAICHDLNLYQDKIIIMPEGVAQDEITKLALAVSDQVKAKGWRLLPRLQVMIWGEKRKT